LSLHLVIDHCWGFDQKIPGNGQTLVDKTAPHLVHAIFEELYDCLAAIAKIR
jgi:hypothetical protein